jgi:formate hydrogenlyase subunit 6/NADH:ubiquinone oxidoreductase subunit I
MWSPMLVPRIGPCEYNCQACEQVCPTGAIDRLTAAQKKSTKIGSAYVDRSRCIPWADGLPCGVCEEVCQVPTKAIKFEIVDATDASGATRKLKRPVVLRSDCIGCGVCEHNCPLPGPAAIRVMTETLAT